MLDLVGRPRFDSLVRSHKSDKFCSYANNTRNNSIFYDLFSMLVSELTARGRRKMRKNLFAVDATTISFNKDDYPWADFRETKAGIKIHVQYST